MYAIRIKYLNKIFTHTHAQKGQDLQCLKYDIYYRFKDIYLSYFL